MKNTLIGMIEPQKDGTDAKLFNLSRLKVKTKVPTVLLREMLFADDAALTSLTEEGLQQLINQFAHACKALGLS